MLFTPVLVGMKLLNVTKIDESGPRLGIVCTSVKELAPETVSVTETFVRVAVPLFVTAVLMF